MPQNPPSSSTAYLGGGNCILVQGRIQDFHWGGGRKRLCARMHIANPKPEDPYYLVPGPAERALEAFTEVLMLSRAIWALVFKHSDFKNGIKNSHSDFKGEGAPTVAPPINPPLPVQYPQNPFWYIYGLPVR